MRKLGFFLASCHAILSAQTPTAASLIQALRASALDPDQCYLVRDLSFYRDDIKLYFNDGYLIFSMPVAGERISAVFAGNPTPDVDANDIMTDGEIILLPPRPDERRSLSKYTGAPNLDEHFHAAILTLTDGSARALLAEIAARGPRRPPPAVARALADRWNPAVAALNDSLAQRTTADLLSPVRQGGGYLFASLQGDRLGNFDVIYDPISSDQIVAGQLVEHNGAARYDIWTSFPARPFRQGTVPSTDHTFTTSDYRITAALDESLHLKATTRLRITVGENPVRVLIFGMSRAERATAARIDGELVELSLQESQRDRALRADENNVFLAVAPIALAPGSSHVVEIEHEGAVIADRGSGVFAVDARANWYPRAALEFSTYDLEFRYPRDLTLVTPGEIVEDRVDGDWRVTRRRTPGPIRLAGFNLGHYAVTSATVGELTVNVYGNRGLDPALAPLPRAVVVPQAPQVSRPASRGAPPSSQTMTVIQTPPPPDPLGRLQAVAADVSESLRFFTSLFGPPPLKSLAVSPIPGTSGQGFPGLIYLSTLSYIEERQRPQSAQDSRQQTFFSGLMAAHEVAHQWWGNTVAASNYQDEWIVEGLAQYSALLWLEKKGGPAFLQAQLNDFRRDLETPGSDGAPLESYGPLTWGYRLESARDPETFRVITYEKGAWIFHMLRNRLGDSRFFAMLAELRRRFEYTSITTQQLQALAKEFGPPNSDAIDTFFDTWVRSTGIPSVRVKYTITGLRLTGTLELSSDQPVEIPLEIQSAAGPPLIEWIKADSRTQPFSITLKKPAAKIAFRAPATLIKER